MDPTPEKELLLRAAQDDSAALDELFQMYRHRLKGMLHWRLDPRLRTRVDESDVIQETLVDAARKFSEYAQAPQLPFYLWLRHLAGLKLAELHRTHLSAQKRSARRETSLEFGDFAPASSVVLADAFAGNLTSPSEAAMRHELKRRCQELLDSLEPIDREVLVLKHFEQLSTAETASVLGISKAGAGRRYLAALKRLRAALSTFSGLVEL